MGMGRDPGMLWPPSQRRRGRYGELPMARPRHLCGRAHARSPPWPAPSPGAAGGVDPLCGPRAAAAALRAASARRHVRCVILHPAPRPASLSLFLSVTTALRHPNDAGDDRHTRCGSAHRS